MKRLKQAAAMMLSVILVFTMLPDLTVQAFNETGESVEEAAEKEAARKDGKAAEKEAAREDGKATGQEAAREAEETETEDVIEIPEEPALPGDAETFSQGSTASRSSFRTVTEEKDNLPAEASGGHLVALDWIEEDWDDNGYVASRPNEDANWKKGLESSLGTANYYLGWYTGTAFDNPDGEESISANDTAVKWLPYADIRDALEVTYKSQADDTTERVVTADTSCLTLAQAQADRNGEMTDKTNVTEISFYKTGIYYFRYQESELRVTVGFPDFGAYETEAADSAGYIRDTVNYEKDFSFYLLNGTNADCKLGAEELDGVKYDSSQKVYASDTMLPLAKEILDITEIQGSAKAGYKISVHTDKIQQDSLNICFPYTAYNEEGGIDYTGAVYLTLRQDTTKGVSYAWENITVREIQETSKYIKLTVGQNSDIYLYTYNETTGRYVPVTDLSGLTYDASALEIREIKGEDTDEDNRDTTAGAGRVSVKCKKTGETLLHLNGSGILFEGMESAAGVYADETMKASLPVNEYGDYQWDFHNDTIYVQLGNAQIKRKDVTDLQYPMGVSLQEMGNGCYKFKIESYLALNLYQNINLGFSYERDGEEGWENISIAMDITGDVFDRTNYESGESGRNYSGCYLYTDTWYDPYLATDITFAEYEDNISWNPMPTQELADKYSIYWFNADHLQELIHQMGGLDADEITFASASNGAEDLRKKISEINTGECMFQPSVTDATVLPDEYLYTGGGFDRILVRFSANSAATNAGWEDEEGEFHFYRNEIYQLDAPAADKLNQIIGAVTVQADDYIEVAGAYDENENNQGIYLVSRRDEKDIRETTPYRFDRGRQIVTFSLYQEKINDIEGDEESDTLLGYLRKNNRQQTIVKSFPVLHINADTQYNFAGWFNHPVYFAMGTNTKHTLNVLNYDENTEDVQFITYAYEDLLSGKEKIKNITTDFVNPNTNLHYKSIDYPIVLTEQMVLANKVDGSYVKEVGTLAEGEEIISISQNSLPDISGQDEVTMSEEQMKALEEDGAALDVTFDMDKLNSSDAALSDDTKQDITGINKELEKINESLPENHSYKTAEIIDLNVNASVRDKDGNIIGFNPAYNDVLEDGSINIHEFYKPIRMSLRLPGKFLGDGVDYKLLCVHNGKTMEIAASYRDGYLTFEADCFSTYAILYNGEAVLEPQEKEMTITGVEQPDGSIRFDEPEIRGEFVYSDAPLQMRVNMQIKTRDAAVITLAEGTDYKVSYKNNRKAGTMTVMVKGLGAYKKQISFAIPVVIRALDFTDEKESGVAVADLTFKASQAGKGKAKPVVYFNGKKLKLHKDYEIYAEGRLYDTKKPLDAATNRLTLKGIGNFTGERVISVQYLAKEDSRAMLSKATVRRIRPQILDGMEVQLEDVISGSIKIGKLQPVYGRDYTISYAGNTRTGTAYAVLRAVKDSDVCTGSKVIPFKMKGKSLGKALVSLTYDGKTVSDRKGEGIPAGSPMSAIIPQVTVTLDGKELTPGTDYRTVITKNRKPGTATLTIYGENGYTGKKTVKFKIVSN